jgi:hypothetical protein
MNCFHKVFAFVFTCLMLISFAHAQDGAGAATPSNETILQKMQQLEQEVKDLTAEVSALKSAAAPATPAAAPATTAAAPAAATPAPAAAATASSASAASAPTGLAGLLGNTTLSGFVDAYYGYNSNHPPTRQNGLRNFDVNTNQFGLNMIELVADKSVDATNRLGYHIALGFGQAMNIYNSASPGESSLGQDLKEGYLEYMAPVGKGLQINFGKFVTPAGAEVLESKDNWNYSRSLLFSYAIPYFHFGASAKYAFNPKIAVTAYVVNGWNNTIDNNTGKTAGFSAAWTPNAKFSITETYLGGPELTNDNSDFRQLTDTVITYNPNAKLSFMANYDFGRQTFDTAYQTANGIPFALAKWSGLAGYVKYAPPTSKWALALRGEYFNDNQGFMTLAAPTGKKQELSEFTATLQRTFAGKLIARLEGRRDMTDDRTFLRGPDGIGVGGQNTITLGLIYAFSSADAK